MQFEVRALSADNRLQTLVVEAEDLAAARKSVEDQRLKPVTIKGVSAARSFGKRKGSFSLVMFSQELLSLLEAGLTLVEGIEALLEKETAPASRSIMDSILQRMREGRRFSDAVGMLPEYFPPLFVGIVKAAEKTSDLPRALGRFIDYQTRVDQVRQRIIGATIYPSILFAVGGLVGLFLMMYVVPKFAAVYKDSGRDLPFMSKLLLSWGEFISNHFIIVFLCAALIVSALVWLVRRNTREGRWAQLAERLPGIGERARILELSRLYLTIGMLLEGGIPVVGALDMVGGTVSAKARDRITRARADISNGEMVSRAFELHGLSTPIALRMLRVGEKSGQLGAMLTRSALFYEGESARWIERFSKTFEPALMALIGVVIGFIVVLLYMPIFDLAGSLQ